MDLPTPESVEQLIATLEAHQRKTAGGSPAALQTIRGRLLGAQTPAVARGAVWREWECGTVAHDGYSTQTLGDGMPRGGGSGLTATESAASGRMARPPRDEHRRLTYRAVAALERAVASINDLVASLDALDVLRGTDAIHEPCEACGPHRDVLADIHRRGDVGGRLETPHALCLACYNYVVRYGRLPVATDIAYHEGTGRWPR